MGTNNGTEKPRYGDVEVIGIEEVNVRGVNTGRSPSIKEVALRIKANLKKLEEDKALKIFVKNASIVTFVQKSLLRLGVNNVRVYCKYLKASHKKGSREGFLYVLKEW